MTSDLSFVGDFSPIPQEPEPPNREPRWCPDCGGIQTFVVVETCEAGRVGYCNGCESRKLIPWERTNSEAA